MAPAAPDPHTPAVLDPLVDCGCGCHVPGHTVLHFAPCCERCACGRHIAFGAMDRHRKDCPAHAGDPAPEQP